MIVQRCHVRVRCGLFSFLSFFMLSAEERLRLGAAAAIALGVGYLLGSRSSGRRVSSHPLLQKALDALPRALTPRANPMPCPTPSTITLPRRLPKAGLGDVGALDALAPIALDGCAQLNHPGYLAHMDPASADVASAAALWQVATNQNLLHPDAAPSARGLEQRVVEWLAPYFGMGGGHLTAGSTLANLTAIWAARELAGVKRVIASDRSHNSLRKAADLLGLEYQSIPSDPATHACDMNVQLAAEVVGDLSDACVVLTAGTVAAGAVDVLSQGCRPSKAAWVHVDAAWAGPMRLSPALTTELAVVEHADSCGFSAHKWLYQPKGCAIVLFKDPLSAHHAMSYGGGYLATPTVGVVGSHPASALPLAATLLAWGSDGTAARLEADIAKLEELATLIAADGRFELWGRGAAAGAEGAGVRRPSRSSSCGVLVWRPRNDVAEAATVRDKYMRGAWVSLTVIDGETWFRSVAANPNADPALVFRSVVTAVEEACGARKAATVR